MYYAFSKKGTLFKGGGIIQGRTLFKEIRYSRFKIFFFHSPFRLYILDEFPNVVLTNQSVKNNPVLVTIDVL